MLSYSTHAQENHANEGQSFDTNKSNKKYLMVIV